jgi:hypothetical protein
MIELLEGFSIIITVFTMLIIFGPLVDDDS